MWRIYVFGFVCWMATAKMATSAPLPLLGNNLFPTVLLNLEESNHSDTQCVTVNGRDLCTTITNCPREAYECSYLDPSGGGHSCGFNSYQCACTATYGNDTCRCDVTPHVPYWVTTRVSCPKNNHEVDLFSDTDLTNSDCSKSVGYYDDPPELSHPNESACYRGSAHFSMRGQFQVNWNCARDGDESWSDVQGKAVSVPQPDKECTCHATYRYQDCSSCQPCPHDEPGSFRAVCPGFFMDCFQTYSVWEEDEEQASIFSTFSTGTRVSLTFGTVAVVILLLRAFKSRDRAVASTSTAVVASDTHALVSAGLTYV
jgi:hypothetical protein